MNYDTNSIYMNMEKNKKDFFYWIFIGIGFLSLFYFFCFRSYSSFYFWEKEGLQNKVKGFFVPNSYVFNRWIGAYSGLESCLGEYCLIISTNFKPQLVFFVCILCQNVLLDNLHNLHFHYKSVTYLGVSNHPLVFVQPPVMIIRVW